MTYARTRAAAVALASFADTVADNASSGWFALGTDRLSLGDFEPERVGLAGPDRVRLGRSTACRGPGTFRCARADGAAASRCPGALRTIQRHNASRQRRLHLGEVMSRAKVAVIGSVAAVADGVPRAESAQRLLAARAATRKACLRSCRRTRTERGGGGISGADAPNRGNNAAALPRSIRCLAASSRPR